MIVLKAKLCEYKKAWQLTLFLINADYSGKFIEKPAKLFKGKEKQFLKSLEL